LTSTYVDVKNVMALTEHHSTKIIYQSIADPSTGDIEVYLNWFSS